MHWLRLFLVVFLAGSAAGALAPREGSRLSAAAAWLQSYLRIDTTNPPGNEHEAAAFLSGILHREGIASRLFVTPGGRTSLYARLSGPQSSGRALVLLHHMDVVSAGPGWKVPPFSGRLVDGALWGRGALDDKSLGIAQLAAFLAARRRAARLERDLIYLAVADEERGGLQGADWLLREHPELFRGVEAVMGEGGRAFVVGERLLWWGVEVAQKRPLWLRVTAVGRGGHGSALNPHSANHRLVAGLSRLLSRPPRWRVTEPSRLFLRSIAPLQNDKVKRTFLDIDRFIQPEGPTTSLLMPGMGTLFLDTVQVTVLSGGRQVNVIPEKASARIDIRLLPDTDGDAFLEDVRRQLGDGLGTEILLHPGRPGVSSPPSGRFYEAVLAQLGREAPVVPAFIPGITDSRFFRERGIPAYGVSPFLVGPDVATGIHGPNERIPLRELDRGVERTIRIVMEYSGLSGD
jgi:acetylornithine deacetylase/succinyl-diaminopimelate desuccinylase-like protein